MSKIDTYKPHEYIFYYDETSERSPVKLVALGSKKAAEVLCPMIKSVVCTYSQACAEARRMNLELKITKKRGRPRK